MGRIISRMVVTPNLGPLNRWFRIMLGIVLLDVAIAHLQMDGSVVTWTVYVAWFALYPLITGLLGWDYVHDLIGSKTCDIADRNWGRIFSYKIDTTLKSNRMANNDYGHRLVGSHH